MSPINPNAQALMEFVRYGRVFIAVEYVCTTHFELRLTLWNDFSIAETKVQVSNCSLVVILSKANFWAS